MTEFEVLLSETARKQLGEAGGKDSGRIRRGLLQLAADPFRSQPGADIRKLVGSNPPMYRLRVGDWRALYFVIEGQVRVTSIRRRENAYD